MIKNRLNLNKRRKFNHYKVGFWIIAVTFIFFVIILYGNLSSDVDDLFRGMEYFLIPLTMGLMVTYYQYRNLEFKTIEIEGTILSNTQVIKSTIKNLKWEIASMSTSKFEVINPDTDFRTFGDELITIIPENNKILVNSICNVDGKSSQVFSWGKNKQNIKVLKNEIEKVKESRN